MINIAQRRWLQDELEYFWWRSVLHAARIASRSRNWLWPLVWPVRELLWVPAVALLCGILIGWALSAS